MFYLGSGEHAGAIHLRARIPGQDRVASGTVVVGEQTFTYGLAIDGNSSGKNSEFGSIIGRYHLVREITRLLTDGTPLQEIPQYLFDSLEDELRRLLPPHAKKREVVDFILNYLIFTVVGFIQGPEETIVFCWMSYSGSSSFYQVLWLSADICIIYQIDYVCNLVLLINGNFTHLSSHYLKFENLLKYLKYPVIIFL